MESNRKPLHEIRRISPMLQDFRGEVILPGDDAYEAARRILMGQFDRHPEVIFRPADAMDIARIVGYASDTGRELAVRSGGHSLAGHSVSEGGIVLDLRQVNSLEIDPKSRSAWAGSGLTAGEYTRAAALQGLVTGFGDTPTVGIGGLTLGGGVGYLVRRNGLTIDELLAAEVVTADGQVVHTDKESHPDLFWAIRGGGGNFGVVSRFKFRLHSIDQVLGGMLILPATVEVIERFVAESMQAPDELSSILTVMPAPPMPFLPAEVVGKPVVLAMMLYSGSSMEEGARVLAPFRAIAKPIVDMIHPMHYPEIYPPEGPEMHPLVVADSLFIDKVDRSDAQAIVDAVIHSDAPMRTVQLRVLGGAMARVPSEATAFPHRTAKIMVNIVSFYSGDADIDLRKEWVAQLADTLHQGYNGAYVNFLGESSPEKIREAYTEECWRKLTRIKKQYDPANLFHMNQNIPPQ